jgi:ABC-type hemin transport system substrate-binding protein
MVAQLGMEVGAEVHGECAAADGPQPVIDVLRGQAGRKPVREVLGKRGAHEGLIDRVGGAGAVRLFLGVDRLVAEAEGAQLESDGSGSA